LKGLLAGFFIGVCGGFSFAQPAVSPSDLGFSERSLSIPESRNLERLKREISETEIGRKLLAETSTIPAFIGSVKKNRLIGYVFAPDPRFVFSKNALAKVPSPDIDLALIRALSIASLDLPIKTEDSLFYARVNRVLFAVEYGVKDSQFSRDFNSSVLAAQKLVAEEIGRKLMHGELEKTAFDSVLFSRDPYSLYRVSDQVPFVSEIRDFIQLYGPDFDGVISREEGRLVVAAGKVYPGVFLEDAQKLIHWGGIRRLREVPFYRAEGLELFSQKTRRALRTQP
jgi:hypothetical protein